MTRQVARHFNSPSHSEQHTRPFSSAVASTCLLSLIVWEYTNEPTPFGRFQKHGSSSSISRSLNGLPVEKNEEQRRITLSEWKSQFFAFLLDELKYVFVKTLRQPNHSFFRGSLFYTCHYTNNSFYKPRGAGGGGTPLQEANGAVPLDPGVAFSRPQWLYWGHIFNRVTRTDWQLFGCFGVSRVSKYGKNLV